MVAASVMILENEEEEKSLENAHLNAIKFLAIKMSKMKFYMKTMGYEMDKKRDTIIKCKSMPQRCHQKINFSSVR